MCRLRNIAMRDYQESVTTGQTDGWTDRQTPKGQKSRSRLGGKIFCSNRKVLPQEIHM